MSVLTQKGIDSLMSFKTNQPVVVQLISFDKSSHREGSCKATISDGTVQFETNFIGQAAKYIQETAQMNDVITILEWIKIQNSDTELEIKKVEFKRNHGALIGSPKGIDLSKITLHFDKKVKEKIIAQADNSPIGRGFKKFGFAFIAGICAAYFVKRTIRRFAYVTGGFFLLLQTMAYNGLITIHWNNFFPNLSMRTIVEMLSYQSTGFMLGFYFGIRKAFRNL